MSNPVCCCTCVLPNSEHPYKNMYVENMILILVAIFTDIDLNQKDLIWL